MLVDIPEEVLKVFKRLQKLYALSTKNSSEAEIANAVAQIQSTELKLQTLLVKHGLTLDQVSGEASDAEGNIDKRPFDMRVVFGQPIDWRKALLFVLADTNGARAITISGTVHAYIIGKAHSKKVIQYMYDYITAEIVRLGNVYWNQLRVTAEEQGLRVVVHPLRWKDSFYKGAAKTVARRLYAQLELDRENMPGANELVLVRDALVKEAEKEFFPRAKAHRSAAALSRIGFKLGQAAGKEVQFKRGLEAETKDLLLLSDEGDEQ